MSDSRVIKNVFLKNKAGLKMQVRSTPDLRKILRNDMSSRDFVFDPKFTPTAEQKLAQDQETENFLVKEIEYQKLLLIQQRQEQSLKEKLLRQEQTIANM